MQLPMQCMQCRPTFCLQTDLLLAAPILGAACMLQSKPALRALAVYTC